MRNPLLGFSVLVAVILSGCQAEGAAVAATVNGVTISVGEVQAMRLNADPGAAVVDKDQFATDLTDAIINLAIVEAAKEEFGIDPTAAEVAARELQIDGQIQEAQGMTAEEFFGQQGLPIERLGVIARQQMIKEALDEEFKDDIVPATDADAELLLTADGIARTTACVSHILVATEEEANAALERINGGEAFADVAREVGTDATAPVGGELGCQALGLYVPDFAEAAYGAELNEVTGPVETQFGFHLVLVTSREQPSLAEVRADIDLQRVNEQVTAWILESIRAAEITVESQYGTWVLDPSPQVQAPAG